MRAVPLDDSDQHADATAIGSSWTASYDTNGDLLGRAATCATTQTDGQLRYDNAGQLSIWQNTPSNPTATDSFLYDGEVKRVEQVATSGGTTTTTTYVGSLEEIIAPSNAPTSTTAITAGWR